MCLKEKVMTRLLSKWIKEYRERGHPFSNRLVPSCHSEFSFRDTSKRGLDEQPFVTTKI